MKSKVQSTTVMVIQLDESEIRMLKGLVQNYVAYNDDSEGAELKAFRQELFEACEHALKHGMINAN